jgi:hypothetical protein
MEKILQEAIWGGRHAASFQAAVVTRHEKTLEAAQFQVKEIGVAGGVS